MRSLHPADAVHKGFGTIPTSILQRKNGVCIDKSPACHLATALKMAQKKQRPLFWNLRFSGFLEPFGCGLHDN